MTGRTPGRQTAPLTIVFETIEGKRAADRYSRFGPIVDCDPIGPRV